MKLAVASKKKAIKITLWCVLGAALLFVFIVLGSLLVQKFIKKSSVPMFAGVASLIVQTGSMNGTIDEGDLIFIKKTKDYELGDIVTYVNSAKEVVTHRLVNYGPEEGTFIAKGDANSSLDQNPVSVDQIVGEVVLTIPKFGLVIQWFSHEGGVIYVVAMIAIVIAGVYLWNAMKPESEKAEEGAETLADTQEKTNIQEEQSSENVETTQAEPPQDEKGQ